MNAVLLFGLTDPWDKTLPLKKANRLAAAAVRYLDFSSKDWTELVTLINLPFGTKYALEAEMIAIHDAFRKACELTDNFDRLLIFTDCQSILDGLIAKSKFSYLSKPDWITNLFTYANMLYDLGITAELRWVPSHSSVEGNERVDKLAVRLRRYGQSLLPQDEPEFILFHVQIPPNSAELLREVHKVQPKSEERVGTGLNKPVGSRFYAGQKTIG